MIVKKIIITLLFILIIFLYSILVKKDNFININNKKKNRNLALTTCNNNEKYYKWIKYIIPFWHNLNFDLIIYFYADNIPPCLHKYKKYIVLVEPPNDLYIPSVCQISRLYLPILHKNYDKVLITDIDLIPISKKYFNKINTITNDKFIVMRKKENEYFMPFNAANYKLWAELTNLNENITLEQINKHLITIFNNNKKDNKIPIKVSWGLDQLLLAKYCKKLPNDKKVIWTNLDNFLLIDTEWKALKAFYKGKKYNISKTEIKNNLENIIFFTRNEYRNENLKEKVEFLNNILNIN